MTILGFIEINIFAAQVFLGTGMYVTIIGKLVGVLYREIVNKLHRKPLEV